MQSLINKIQSPESPPTEEVPNCPLCGSYSSSLLFESFDRLHHLPGRFSVIQCGNCDLARLSPRPAEKDLGFYYPEENYYSYQILNTEVPARGGLGKLRDSIRKSVFQSLNYPVGNLTFWEKSLQPLFVHLFKDKATFGWGDRFPRFIPEGRALDIGCGSGRFLSVLKRFGWEVNGIEMSRRAAEVAKTTFDIDVFCGEISQAPFEKESFDYIHLSHVLEHFVDPVKALQESARFLKPNGIIFIEVPNINGFGQIQNGKYWFHWDSPRHLFGFSPKTLQKTVEKAGLHVINTKTFVVDYWEWEATYKLEETLGRKFDIRPKVQNKDKIRNLILKQISKITNYINNQNGDFLCCWVKKERL